MLTRLATRPRQLLARNITQLVSANQRGAPRSLIAKQFNTQLEKQQQLRAVLTTRVCSRTYCSSRKKQDEEELLEQDQQDFIINKDPQLPATVAVPEVWPHVPLLATKRNPVFPRFMKILEVQFLCIIVMIYFIKDYIKNFCFLTTPLCRICIQQGLQSPANRFNKA